MDIEDLYFKPITFNNIIYSCDMLRLKCYIDVNTFGKIKSHIYVFFSQCVAKYWESDRIQCFKYNYNIVIDEGISFYFGFFHNSEKDKDINSEDFNFTIEFNPNKLKDHYLIRYLLGQSSCWFIKSYDLAMDLKINIRDIIYDKGSKRKYNVFGSSPNNKTIHIGTKGRDMFLKIYNKKIESQLDINYELTRVELSRICEDYPISDIKSFDFGNNFPDIYLNQYLYSLSDYKDKTLMACIYAVQSGFSINDLSRTYKEKIKSLFEGGCKIIFDRISATNALIQVLYHYFAYLNNV